MADLEPRLHEIARHIEWPKADLAGPVAASIEAGERPVSGWRWLRVAMAAAAIAVLVLATPAGRQAVADILEVGGIHVGWGVEAGIPGAELDLGDEVTLREAGDLPFPVLIPIGAGVGEPDAIYHSDFPPGGAVHFVWRSGEALPAAGDTGVGLIYSQFRIAAGSFIKSLGPGVEASPVTVRGNPGFWIEGAPHILFYEDETGAEERARLAANVLAWEEDGVTHRIETTLSLEDTLDLAESLEPMT